MAVLTVDYTVVLPPFDASLVNELHALAEQVFGRVKRDNLEWRLSNMPNPSVHIARASGLVGFKLGYALKPRLYYSWLGGVDEEHRRQGIALRLTQDQHDWARGNGYREIETGLVSSNIAMLSLNLKVGFQVTGTHTRTSGPRIIMSKQL